VSTAPWAPKSRPATSVTSPSVVNNGGDRLYPDGRVNRAATSNEVQEPRSSSVRRTSVMDSDRAFEARPANVRAAGRAEANYGFTGERPGPTRTAFSAAAQGDAPRYRVATRSYESPYSSPRGRGAYRLAGHEQMPTPAEEIPGGQGTMMYEQGPEMWDGDGGYDGSCSSCGGGCRNCGDCDDCEPCDDCAWIPPDWSDNITVFGGVHGFKGSIDQGLNGNFGFHEGVNMGVAVCRDFGLGVQAGVNFVQSDFLGSANIPEDRNQTFFTLGVFRRAPECGGFQGGTAVDWLRDEYNVFMNLSQLRTELSYVGECGNEIGFWGTRHLKGDHDEINEGTESVSWRAVDQYNFFFRRHFRHGGEGRVWGGFTGHGDGLIGADMRIPFACSFAIEPSFEYLIPKKSDDSFAQEGFNVSINLVWYLHCRARRADCSPFRPLFNVADNGTFMVQTTHQEIDD
jgi:hypothetical protein